MLVSLVVIAVFVAGTAAMVTRALPALLALPAMALALAFTAMLEGGVTIQHALDVLAQGATRLDEAMIVALLGGVLSAMLQTSGVARELVKHGAELAGDRPIGVCVAVLILVALLFTSVGGLGALIMVAMIVLPVLSTLGVRPAVAGGVLLFGMSLGGLLNAGNWVLYTETLGLAAREVHRFAVALAGLGLAAAVAFIVASLWRDGLVSRRRDALTWLLGSAALAVAVLAWTSTDGAAPSDAATDGGDRLGVAQWIVAALVAIACLHAVVVGVSRLRDDEAGSRPRWSAFLIPFLPLALILAFDVPIVAAFLIGLVYAILATLRRGWRNDAVKSLLDGATAVLPAILLMLGIGLLVTAILGPRGYADGGETWPILAAVRPLLAIDFSSPITYLLGFSVAAPLALYRGPLNVWGLGFGVATVLASAGLPAPAIMAMMLSVGQIQGICDPTNTHNAWLANELGVDVVTLMTRTLPAAWLLAIAGLAVATLRYL